MADCTSCCCTSKASSQNILYDGRDQVIQDSAIWDHKLQIVFYLFQIKHNITLTFSQAIYTHVFQKIIIKFF